jgi:hypothetical protein
VINRIEEKGLRSGKEEIYNLKVMRQLRKKVGILAKIRPDFVYDNGQNLVTDSSKIAASRLLVRYIRRFKERRAKKKDRESREAKILEVNPTAEEDEKS